jgi:hypothetical protein
MSTTLKAKREKKRKGHQLSLKAETTKEEKKRIKKKKILHKKIVMGRKEDK